MSTNLHEQVSVPKLLFVGGLVETVAAGHAAVAHGHVFVEHWNIGIAEVTLPRWVLRGVTIAKGERSITISEDGLRIVGHRRAQGALT